MSICFYHIRPINIKYEFGEINDIEKYNQDASFNSIVSNEECESGILLIECPICLEYKKKEDSVILNCQHKFCINCLEIYLFRSNNDFVCAYCRLDINKITIYNKYYYYKFRLYTFLLNFTRDEVILVYRGKAILLLLILLILFGLGVLFSV